ncbi:MAG: copper chaperone PCu(A)C [Burkholderiales bacterium]
MATKAMKSIMVMFLFFCVGNALAQKIGIEVSEASIREPVGGQDFTVGYCLLRNAGKMNDKLLKVTSDVIGFFEIHEMSIQNGVMRMRELPDGLVVPKGGVVYLKPGGLHLMLFDIKAPLAVGKHFQAVFHFQKAGPINVSFAVESHHNQKN